MTDDRPTPRPFEPLDRPCGGISINGATPPICEIHLLPWGHKVMLGPDRPTDP